MRMRDDIQVGYGDHLDMITTMLLYQDCLMDTKTYPTILSEYLTTNNLYHSHVVPVFCCNGETKLAAKIKTTPKGLEKTITDISLLDYLNKKEPREILNDSINFFCYDENRAKQFRGLIS